MTKLTRRQTIAGAGGLLALTLAGCTGEDTEYGNNDSDTNSSEDVQNRPEGEDHLTFEDLEILEHEAVREENSYGSYDHMIRGVVINHGNEPYDYVEVGARLYDEDGRHLERVLTNTTDLAPNTEWAFEIPIIRDTALKVQDHDIGITASQ